MVWRYGCSTTWGGAKEQPAALVKTFVWGDAMEQPAAPTGTFARFRLPAIIDSFMLAAGWLAGCCLLHVVFLLHTAWVEVDNSKLSGVARGRHDSFANDPRRAATKDCLMGFP